jgi:hypothetical protein
MKFIRNGVTTKRRMNVIKRLEKQLQSNTKPFEGGIIELSEHDKNRITKELETLKSRI